MKVFICFFVLIPFVFAGPAKPARIYFPEEDDPEFKRFIYVENEAGKLEMVDLKKDVPKPRIAASDVAFDLYTQNSKDVPYIINNNDVSELIYTNFDPNKISMFVAHGWRNNRDSELNRLVRKAALEHHDINLFIIDWSTAANDLYLAAKNSVKPVGELVGLFINKMQDMYGLTGSSFVLVGHSLGAHVVGNAGAVVKDKVDHIIGMDPAGPLFTVNNTEERLDSTDGNFVQIIHTNGELLGFASSIGDADYYPNGGMSQPGCGWDLAGACSHSRSYQYFAESIIRGDVFQAVLCPDYKNFEDGLCAENRKSAMGKILVDKKAFGDYFLKTNPEDPFAMA